MAAKYAVSWQLRGKEAKASCKRLTGHYRHRKPVRSIELWITLMGICDRRGVRVRKI